MISSERFGMSQLLIHIPSCSGIEHLDFNRLCVSPEDGLSKDNFEKLGGARSVGRSHGVLSSYMKFRPFRLDINLQIDRFAASVGRSNFTDTLWNFFSVAVRISSFLDTFSRCRLSFVSSTVYFDSIETSTLTFKQVQIIKKIRW